MTPAQTAKQSFYKADQKAFHKTHSVGYWYYTLHQKRKESRVLLSIVQVQNEAIWFINTTRQTSILTFVLQDQRQGN